MESDSGCPDWDIDELTIKSRDFDRATDTESLECALEFLRNAMPAPIHRTAIPARICFLLADRTCNNNSRREQFASEGVRWAEIAINEGAGLNGAVHYYLGMNLGLAVYEHTALAVKNLKRIASALRKSCQLAPDFDRGGPLRVLGMLYLMAPPWPQGIGDGDKAIELLEAVTKRHPAHPRNHIFYARALWEIEEEDALDQVKQQLLEAQKLLNQGGGKWGSAKQVWLDEIKEIADDAEIELAPAP
ncbi:MAG: hypothetical protein JRJ87_14225 [Deltaproteobacteria bacterium]|nr:hypothetical protein [Deltaproteobacteria bacterium]